MNSIEIGGQSALEVCIGNDLVCVAMGTTLVWRTFVFFQFLGHKTAGTFNKDLYSRDSLHQLTSNNNLFVWVK